MDPPATEAAAAAVVEKTKRDFRDGQCYNGLTAAQRHFNALKRVLDRKGPDYETAS
ncbi:hypothetical protein [Bradyrhizobium altum]|uniref:hypothetical protein n=1 Tax=Bradyrhizobium altum TaxID=1571202 RepID=UPI001E61B133|nr:hypothetical protein [Bradyrhizobium altum]